MLEHADRFIDHNATGNGNREGLKTMDYSAISSQASDGDKDQGKVQRLTIESPSMNERLGLMAGMLLGDSYIFRNGHIRFDHSSKQKEYAVYKTNLLQAMGFDMHFQSRERTIGEKTYGQVYACSPANEFFKVMKSESFYNSGRKFFSEKNISGLTPLGLAIWFMDDGGVESSLFNGKRYYKSLMLSTYSFTKEENKILADALNEKFNIDCRVQNFRDKCFLRIKKPDAWYLAELILPYINMVPSMLYKVNGILADNNIDTSARLSYRWWDRRYSLNRSESYGSKS